MRCEKYICDQCDKFFLIPHNTNEEVMSCPFCANDEFSVEPFQLDDDFDYDYDSENEDS